MGPTGEGGALFRTKDGEPIDHEEVAAGGDGNDYGKLARAHDELAAAAVTAILLLPEHVCWYPKT